MQRLLVNQLLWLLLWVAGRPALKRWHRGLEIQLRLTQHCLTVPSQLLYEHVQLLDGFNAQVCMDAVVQCSDPKPTASISAPKRATAWLTEVLSMEMVKLSVCSSVKLQFLH